MSRPDSALFNLAPELAVRYRLERELGRGGMATVYLVLDLRHDRPVALKLLHAELGGALGPDRFLREIAIAARLQHPNILPLFDSGTASDHSGAVRLYYTMPFVAGESLRVRLDRDRQLGIEGALRIATDVAAALGYAHTHGIVHRDIKPENILLSGEQALVADFGIAKALDTAGGERLTDTGLSLGTPAYMSPEQATAGAADGRSDLYSLGCVLYEMLAGVPPFIGPTAQAILARHAVDPVPSLRTVRPTVPAPVERAISRAMAKVPADRFATAGEFAAALAAQPAARGEESMPVREQAPAFWARALPSRRLVAALTALSVLAVGAVLALRWRPAPNAAPALHRQLTFTGRTGSPAISPDGRWLAYVTAAQPGTREPVPRYTLQVQPLPSGDPVTLADSVFNEPPVWSPDGNTLMFVGRTRARWFVGIQTVARLGGRVTQVGPLSWVYGYRPDGEVLIRATFDTLIVQDILSGSEVQRISLAGKTGNISAVDWSPDGDWIALCAFRQGGDAVALVKPDGSGFQVLANGCRPRWRGDGLYFTREAAGGSDLFRLDLDLRTGRPRGEPRLVFSGLGDGLSLTDDARTLVYSRAPSNVHIWAIELAASRDGLQPRARQLTSGTRAHWSPDLSADGRNVLFLNDGGLFAMPFSADSAPRWVATPRGGVVDPRWSPDGSKVAFALDDSSGSGLFMADQRTGHVAKVRTRGPNIPPELAWSADGKRLVFARAGLREVFLLDLASGRETDLQYESRYRLHSPVFSPDGREVVATDFIGVDAFDGIARTTVGTGRWSHAQTQISNIRFLRWTADGWIYAAVTVGGPDRMVSVHRMRGSGGEFEPYFEAPIPCDARDMAMSADARRFVCTVERYEPDVWIIHNFDPGPR